MSKRITDEDRIVTYFEGAPEMKTEVIFNVIKGIMRRRSLLSGPRITKRKAKADARQAEKVVEEARA